MKVKTAVLIIIALLFTAMPVHANQAAVIPAYAFVSAYQSSMREYHDYINKQNRVAARNLVNSDKVFLSPRDVKVEIVTFDDNIVKVKLNRLDKNAQPVTLYFWTLAEQLKILPQE